MYGRESDEVPEVIRQPLTEHQPKTQNKAIIEQHKTEEPDRLTSMRTLCDVNSFCLIVNSQVKNVHNHLIK